MYVHARLFACLRGFMLTFMLTFEQETWTCLQVAEKMSSMIKPNGNFADVHSTKDPKSSYFRNISSIKIRGTALSVRSLSIILRPLVDIIQERLSSMDMEPASRRRKNDAEDIALRGNHERVAHAPTCPQRTEKMLDLSSDSDAESLTYTASVFTIQVFSSCEFCLMYTINF